MTIKFFWKWLYGRRHAFCVRQEDQAIILALTGHKTLTTQTMECLELLGVKFEEGEQYETRKNP